MNNPYFLPATIDGSPRRPIVERVDACRPLMKIDESFSRLLCYFTTDAAKKHNFIDEAEQFRWVAAASDLDDSLWENDDLALRLTRLAVIEWIQKAHEARPISDEISDAAVDGLLLGCADNDYNRTAHRLADALGVEP